MSPISLPKDYQPYQGTQEAWSEMMNGMQPLRNTNIPPCPVETMIETEAEKLTKMISTIDLSDTKLCKKLANYAGITSVHYFRLYVKKRTWEKDTRALGRANRIAEGLALIKVGTFPKEYDVPTEAEKHKKKYEQKMSDKKKKERLKLFDSFYHHITEYIGNDRVARALLAKELGATHNSVSQTCVATSRGHIPTVDTMQKYIKAIEAIKPKILEEMQFQLKVDEICDYLGIVDRAAFKVHSKKEGSTQHELVRLGLNGYLKMVDETYNELIEVHSKIADAGLTRVVAEKAGVGHNTPNQWVNENYPKGSVPRISRIRNIKKYIEVGKLVLGDG